MTIRTQDDTNVQLAIGSGVLQGDSAAAEQFTAVFNPTVASYIAELSEEDITANLLLQDELTGDQIDPSTTTYADDLVTTATVQDAAHAVRQQQQLNTLLENNVQPVGLTSNNNKKQALASAHGRRAQQLYSSLLDSQVVQQIPFTTQTLYLGAQFHSTLQQKFD
ncbi:unnamed protein product, partial [Polarella glacialis]